MRLLLPHKAGENTLKNINMVHANYQYLFLFIFIVTSMLHEPYHITTAFKVFTCLQSLSLVSLLKQKYVSGHMMITYSLSLLMHHQSHSSPPPSKLPQYINHSSNLQ